jgi:AraC-like DNA-binding protein
MKTDSETRPARTRDDADWRVAGAGRAALAGGAYEQRRDSPYHQIEYIAAGRGWVELGGLRQALAAGSVFAAGPDTRVGLRSDPARPLKRYHLWLDGPDAAARVVRSGLGRSRVRQVSTPGEIRDAWEWLVREMEAGGAASEAIGRALAEVVLLKLEAAGADAGARDAEGSRQTFERCRLLVDAEAARLRGAADLAAAAGLRTETLCRLFRRFLDTTPGAYLRRRRMRLASERLLEQGARVKQVAADLGFADAFHFSRVFKAEMGMTPKAWRERGSSGARRA